jgi:serine protease Do
VALPDRPPMWLVLGGAMLLLITAAFGRREHADAPRPPPPLTANEGAVLARVSPIDPAAVVRIRSHGGSDAGAAFSVADGGVWLTAAAAIAHCPHPAVMISDTEGAASRVAAGPSGDVAVLTTSAGAPALPLAPTLRPGELAYALGYPHSRPGELALRLLGPASLAGRGRGSVARPVLAWAELGRTDGMNGELTALAGSPVLDGEGRVVGVALGEAPRLGRLYSTTPQAPTAALATAKLPHSPQAAGAVIAADDYGLAADDLRRAARIAPIVCAAH